MTQERINGSDERVFLNGFYVYSPLFVNGKRYQASSGGSVLTLAYEAIIPDATTGKVDLLKTGGGLFSTVRASTMMAPDHEGIFRTEEANEPVIQGARRVKNFVEYSNDLTQSNGGGGTSCTVGATTLQYTASTGYYVNKVTWASPFLPIGTELVLRLTISSADKVQIGLKLSPSATEVPCALSSTPKTFTIPYTTVSVIAGVDIILDNRTANAGDGLLGTITVEDIQVEIKTGASDSTIPSEFVATTGTPETVWYRRTNGNSVASYVLTEAVGTELTNAWGIKADKTMTNSMLDSNDMTTANWLSSGTPVITRTVTGIEGLPNTGNTLQDDDSGATEYIYQNPTPTLADYQYYTARFFIKKDSDTSRYPAVYLGLTGGSTPSTCLYVLNTSDGSVTAGPTTGYAGKYRLRDAGLWWELLIEQRNNTGGNTVVETRIYPAYNADGTGNQADAATGSIIVGQAEFYDAFYLAQACGSGPIITTSSALTTSIQSLETRTDEHASNTNGLYYCEWTPFVKYNDAMPGAQTYGILSLGSLASVLYAYEGFGTVRSFDSSDALYSPNFLWDVDSTYGLVVPFDSSVNKRKVGQGGSYGVEGGFDGSWAVTGNFSILSTPGASFMINNIQLYQGGTYDAYVTKADELMA